MFTGRSRDEEAKEADRILHNEDLNEHGKERTPIEASVDEYRSRTMDFVEHVSAVFGKPEATTNQYRITSKSGVVYLEKLGANQAGPHSYTGLVLPEEDLPVIARVFVEATKAYLARKK